MVKLRLIVALSLCVQICVGGPIGEEYATTLQSVLQDDPADDVTTTRSRVVREVGTTGNPDIVFDDSDATTVISDRIKREVATTESVTGDGSLNDESAVTTVIPGRVRRESGVFVTEAVTEFDILSDGTEIPTFTTEVPEVPQGEGREKRSVDSDENFKYPTTPFPDPSLDTPTGIPSFEEVPLQKQSAQRVVTGNRTCQCGTPNRKKIVGGEDVAISELPWTVALVRKRNTTRRGPYCGGTLVSDKYVVTASHCVDGFNATGIEVWINEEDFRVDDENLSNTIRLDVEEIIMHPEYNRKNIDNDIALLKLAGTVDIESGNHPVCLPAENSKTYEGEEAIVAGWGATEQGGSVSATLKKVSVPVLSNKVCNWRTLYLGRITDNQVCAGEITTGGKDSCQGDSGGPLVATQDEQKILIGVVSYGFGCAKPYAPGVYTRVSRYPEWILENSPDAEYCSP